MDMDHDELARMEIAGANYEIEHIIFKKGYCTLAEAYDVLGIHMTLWQRQMFSQMVWIQKEE